LNNPHAKNENKDTKNNAGIKTVLPDDEEEDFLYESSELDIPAFLRKKGK